MRTVWKCRLVEDVGTSPLPRPSKHFEMIFRAIVRHGPWSPKIHDTVLLLAFELGSFQKYRAEMLYERKHEYFSSPILFKIIFSASTGRRPRGTKIFYILNVVLFLASELGSFQESKNTV